MAERRARTTWHGDLASGSGVTEFGSGAIPAQEVSWSARTEESGGRTSPEELIAGAHATCISMALSHGLAQAGTPATQLTTDAVCTFEQREGGFAITSMLLVVRGVVEGLDDAGFKAAAEQAKAGCPVSKALAGGTVEISLDAALEGA
jgi:osmotically inducible protein OsmC